MAVLAKLRKQERVLPLESWRRGSDIPSLGSYLVGQQRVRLVGDFSWYDSVVLCVPFITVTLLFGQLKERMSYKKSAPIVPNCYFGMWSSLE